MRGMIERGKKSNPDKKKEKEGRERALGLSKSCPLIRGICLGRGKKDRQPTETFEHTMKTGYADVDSGIEGGHRKEETSRRGGPHPQTPLADIKRSVGDECKRGLEKMRRRCPAKEGMKSRRERGGGKKHRRAEGGKRSVGRYARPKTIISQETTKRYWEFARKKEKSIKKKRKKKMILKLWWKRRRQRIFTDAKTLQGLGSLPLHSYLADRNGITKQYHRHDVQTRGAFEKK